MEVCVTTPRSMTILSPRHVDVYVCLWYVFACMHTSTPVWRHRLRRNAFRYLDHVYVLAYNVNNWFAISRIGHEMKFRLYFTEEEIIFSLFHVVKICRYLTMYNTIPSERRVKKKLWIKLFHLTWLYVCSDGCYYRLLNVHYFERRIEK